MTIFQLAHITDLHFGRRVNWLNPIDEVDGTIEAASAVYKYIVQSGRVRAIASIFHPSGYNPMVAQELAHALHKKAGSLDAILVTGDLATTGEIPDLSIAADYFHGNLPTWGKAHSGAIPALLSNKLPVISLPGNHDRYQGLTKAPGALTFESVLGEFWDFDQDWMDTVYPNKETGKVRFAILEKDDCRLIVVCGDLSLYSIGEGVGLGGHLGQGRAQPHVLSEMVETSDLLMADGVKAGFNCRVLWAVHFPPKFPTPNDNLALLDDDLLIDLASKASVSYIIAGHTHETCLYVARSITGNSVPVICSGPSCGISNHNDFNYSILRFSFDSSGFACVPEHYKWIDHNFRPQQSFPIGAP